MGPRTGTRDQNKRLSTATTLPPAAATKRPAPRLSVVLLAAALSAGCGIANGTDSSAAALVSGLPKCDPSLLHPRITVAAAASVPGKMIVYVDGVLACMDDASNVDQIVSQVEGYAPPSPSRTAPVPTPAP